MRHLVWLPLLVVLACTPTRPDNGDLGGAKKDGSEAADGQAGTEDHGAGHGDKAEFVWLTGVAIADYREIDIGHGRTARVVKAGSRDALVKLLSKGIAKYSVIVQARQSTSLPPGAFTWYEVAGAKSLTVLHNPTAIPSTAPAVSTDELVVNDAGFGEQVYHKQVDGKHNADGVAEIFVRTIENPLGLLMAHAANPKIVMDDQGTRKPVRNLLLTWAPGTTLTLTGGPCPIPTPNCVVCAVATGQASAKPAPNRTVDVDFTPNNLLLKMY